MTLKNTLKKIFPITLWAGFFFILYVLIKNIDLKAQLQHLITWIDSTGAYSPLIFILFYLCTAGYVLPVILVTMSAGAMYGIFWGSVLVSIAFTLSSALVYTLGYFYGQKLLPKRIQSNKKFQAVNLALKENGFQFVFMLRFVPIVSSIILNLTCGMIRIKFKTFCLATFLGQLPGTLFYVYTGFLANDVLSIQESTHKRSFSEWLFLLFGLTITLAVMILLTKKSKEAMKRIEQKNNPL